jgi:hypothetical protein
MRYLYCHMGSVDEYGNGGPTVTLYTLNSYL